VENLLVSWVKGRLWMDGGYGMGSLLFGLRILFLVFSEFGDYNLFLRMLLDALGLMVGT